MKAEDLALEMLTQCVAGRTLQLARVISAQFDRILAPYGLTAHQLTLLSIVARRQPITARDMLPYLRMDQSTLSRNLERMEAKGWLKIETDSDDARARTASLSTQGEKLLQEAHEGWLQAQAWVHMTLGSEGVAEIKSVAQRLNPLLPTVPREENDADE